VAREEERGSSSMKRGKWEVVGGLKSQKEEGREGKLVVGQLLLFEPTERERERTNLILSLKAS